jgi:hypothetical protein
MPNWFNCGDFMNISPFVRMLAFVPGLGTGRAGLDLSAQSAFIHPIGTLDREGFNLDAAIRLEGLQ